MKPGRKPQVGRPGWRCYVCRGPWIYTDHDPFAEWQAHYIREHMEKK